jgi:hypothetical protein
MFYVALTFFVPRRALQRNFTVFGVHLCKNESSLIKIVIRTLATVCFFINILSVAKSLVRGVGNGCV